MPVSRQIEQAVFDAACAIPAPDLRAEFLDRVCGDDLAQRRRIDGLLQAHEEADEFFREAAGARSQVAAEACKDLPAAPVPEDHGAADDAPGSWIDRYRIEKRIGEGGCGIVYLAEQFEPVRRKVALKVIRLGMDTERVIARFELERQALATMDHPYIARVLDAGATASGRPYFVMTWVRGERITDFCTNNRLSIAERVGLVIQVCQAIQHAHQKGVIHRDIKPSNILVTQDNGRVSPKVIDFGIAKATETSLETDTRYTSGEPFLGTPAYMSPEQADQRVMDVDTRSDIYSLGILLYELLTGRTPHDPKELAAAGVTEMRRILVERRVPTPSHMLMSLERDQLDVITRACRLEGTRLISALAGDLDWVTMKAIEKDRARRYDTVNGFALDLQRYLGNQPVAARPPSRIYLFRKFVRRNRVACLATLAIAGSVVLGAGITYRSYLRERAAREEQARLRSVAENALANEARLRRSSMTRENISQVAVLISEGKTEEADELLRHTPLAEIEPSLEAANVLGSLGAWNAMRGRWAQAAECYMLLMGANRLSSPGHMVSRRDLVASGPVLAEHGDVGNYQVFRNWVIDRFGETESLLAAEQVIQSTLLMPADPGFLDRLEPFRRLLERSELRKDHLKSGWDTEFAAWRAWTLGLLAYRRGEFADAVRWARLAQDFHSEKEALTAAIRPLLAMALYRTGTYAEARETLDLARKDIARVFEPEFVPAYEPLGKEKGYWWDWIQARILTREAERLIGRASEKS